MLTASGAALSSALPDRREAVEHLGAIREGMVEALRVQVLDAPVLSTAKAVTDYLFALMAHLRVEQIRVLFLDAANRLIADEAVSHGSVREAAMPIRDILGRAIVHDATALIVVHNHPSGQLRPSQDDIAATHRVARASRELGIQLHDHLIIGRTGVVSFRELGLLDVR